MTTREQIRAWFDHGVSSGRKYMLIWCDEFDHIDYPEYFDSHEGAVKASRLRSELTRLTAAYDLSGDREDQIAKDYCWAL